jgi:hypothetical protein
MWVNISPRFLMRLDTFSPLPLYTLPLNVAFSLQICHAHLGVSMNSGVSSLDSSAVVLRYPGFSLHIFLNGAAG